MGCIKPNCMYWRPAENRCVIYKRRPKNRDCKMAHSVSVEMNAERPKYGY